jgi:hypothetical protein
MPTDVAKIRAELRALRAERGTIIKEYGDMAQYHPMHAAIGGLNPAAQRLHYVRRSIAALEHQLRPPKAVLTPKFMLSPQDLRTKGGLLYDVSYSGRTAMIGRSQGALPHFFYLVENGVVLPGEHKTLGRAVKAFEQTQSGHVTRTSLSNVLDLGRKP